METEIAPIIPKLIISGESLLILLVPKVRKGSSREWISKYQCKCGNVKEIADTRVTNGVKSCGCLQRLNSAKAASKNFKTHGLSKTKEYRTWGDMIARCTIPSQTHYSYYGGRGISVCSRWRIFLNFLEDMGPKPEGLSLERINNDGNYEPSNCKWATKSEQMKNRRYKKRLKKSDEQANIKKLEKK